MEFIKTHYSVVSKYYNIHTHHSTMFESGHLEKAGDITVYHCLVGVVHSGDQELKKSESLSSPLKTNRRRMWKAVLLFIADVL